MNQSLMRTVMTLSVGASMADARRGKADTVDSQCLPPLKRYSMSLLRKFFESVRYTTMGSKPLATDTFDALIDWMKASAKNLGEDGDEFYDKLRQRLESDFFAIERTGSKFDGSESSAVWQLVKEHLGDDDDQQADFVGNGFGKFVKWMTLWGISMLVTTFYMIYSNDVAIRAGAPDGITRATTRFISEGENYGRMVARENVQPELYAVVRLLEMFGVITIPSLTDYLDQTQAFINQTQANELIQMQFWHPTILYGYITTVGAIMLFGAVFGVRRGIRVRRMRQLSAITESSPIGQADTCTMCQKSAIGHCFTCKSDAYCSVSCQKQAWVSGHSSVCHRSADAPAY